MKKAEPVNDKFIIWQPPWFLPIYLLNCISRVERKTGVSQMVVFPQT